MSIRFDVWLEEAHPNGERLRREIERSHAEAREIARQRRQRKREEHLLPWIFAVLALIGVFGVVYLFDLL